MKPMLAAKVDDTKKLQFPLWVSPKLDGVRALIINGVVMSRSLKPLPNKHVQSLFGKPEFEGLDGELICGDPCSPDVYRKTTSAVMSVEGIPDIQFWMFDKWASNEPFSLRYKNFSSIISKQMSRSVILVPQVCIFSLEELDQFEKNWLDEGYEGVMLRSPSSPYKHGRSTLKEGYLMKLKRFEDSEAEILGSVELMHNDNEATKDELGHTKRSSKKAGMRPAGMLGALKVRDLKSGVEFEIGSGFDEITRRELWKIRSKLPGSLVKYRFFPGGVKDKPRFPTWLGFRDEKDM